LTTFLVAALNKEAKTTKLTPPTVQISQISYEKSTLALPGVHLQLSSVNLAPNVVLRPRSTRAPNAPPSYAYIFNFQTMLFVYFTPFFVRSIDAQRFVNLTSKTNAI